MEEYTTYTRRVIGKARKMNKELFTIGEYQALKKKMDAARMKVNLRCSVGLLLGVIDEHGLLKPGEVLVGNGQVEGPVWICRSPCTAPGDIQRAYAVARQRQDVFTQLGDVLVFPAKGDRPLADQLTGGDLDGDEYYVIVSVVEIIAFSYDTPVVISLFSS